MSGVSGHGGRGHDHHGSPSARTGIIAVVDLENEARDVEQRGLATLPALQPCGEIYAQRVSASIVKVPPQEGAPAPFPSCSGHKSVAVTSPLDKDVTGLKFARRTNVTGAARRAANCYRARAARNFGAIYIYPLILREKLHSAAEP